MFPIKARTVLDSNRALSTTNDLVAAAISLFNYEKFITECLESVAGQTHSPLELIVVDDCSTDHSLAIAQDWMESHKGEFQRVLLLQHAANEGLSQTRNTAFRNAKADFVLVLDSDNALYPRTIARLLDTIQATGAGAAYSQLEYFGGQIGLGNADVWNPTYFRSGNYVDAMALISKSAWERVGGFSDMSYGWEDYDFWCKFIESDIEGIFVPEVLCRYRAHGGSMTAGLLEQQQEKLTRTIHEITLRHPWLELRLPG